MLGAVLTGTQGRFDLCGSLSDYREPNAIERFLSLTFPKGRGEPCRATGEAPGARRQKAGRRGKSSQILHWGFHGKGKAVEDEQLMVG